ncbi:MAG: GerMN domain-containing protein [Patescibacteria group bacterium]
MGNKFIAAAVIAAVVIVGLIFFGNGKFSGVAISDFESCVSAGYPILESYPEQCRVPGGNTYTRNIGNELEKLDLIQAANPRPGEVIESPLLIDGEARGTWYFEASFPVVLLDEKGTVIATSHMEAQGEWMTEEFVPFKGTIAFTVPETETGTLVLKKDNPSGLPEHDDELRIPVRFKPSAALIKVKTFFANAVLDPAISCDKVFPVEREVPLTKAVGRAAIQELLEGPTIYERESEYVTAINDGVALQSLTIENGVARADFSEELDRGVAGSCRVTTIRSQITKTLTQFASVKTVIISVNGRTADILQP